MLKRHKPVLGLRALGIVAILATMGASLSARAETPDHDLGDQTPAPAASPAPTQTAALASQVNINNFDFVPMSLTVTVGTKVTWTNHDDIPHTVTSADTPPAFKSPALDTDDSFSVTFSKPGTYSYFCSVHPKMVGSIVVRAN